jgi:hypothetical protein
VEYGDAGADAVDHDGLGGDMEYEFGASFYYAGESLCIGRAGGKNTMLTRHSPRRRR